MGEWQDLTLPTSEGETASPFISGARLENLMAVPNPPGSLRPFAVTHIPSLNAHGGLGSGLMRGIAAVISSFNSSGFKFPWYVRDTHLYAYAVGTAFDLGALTGLTSGNSPCRIVPVGLDKAIVVSPSDGAAWLVEATYNGTTFTPTITSVSLPAGSIADATWKDGYTVYLRFGTDEWYISALDDPTTINALDFTTIDAEPDVVVGCATVNGELLIFGANHVEFYYDSGNNLFPFTRQQPGVAHPGALFGAEATIAVIDNLVFYRGTDGRVYEIDGYIAKPASTQWVQNILNSSSSGFPFGSAYLENGRRLYSLSVPGSPFGVLVYDIDAAAWHIRSRREAGSTSVTTHAGVISIGQLVYEAANRPSSVSDLYLQNNSLFHDDGAGNMLRELVLPSFEAAGRRVFEEAVRLDMAATTADNNGKVQFDYADGNAASFITHGSSSLAADADAATSQSTDQEIIAWWRVGSYMRRQHRFRIFVDAPVIINAVQHRYDLGAP